MARVLQPRNPHRMVRGRSDETPSPLFGCDADGNSSACGMTIGPRSYAAVFTGALRELFLAIRPSLWPIALFRGP